MIVLQKVFDDAMLREILAIVDFRKKTATVAKPLRHNHFHSRDFKLCHAHAKDSDIKVNFIL